MAPVTLPTLNVGDVIGEYRLSLRLGEGPRGVVWRASRIDRVQNSILKLIKPSGFELGRPIQTAFEQLADTLTQHGRFDHPNLAGVVGTARRTQDGLFGLATEYLEARNLDVFPFRAPDSRSIIEDASAFANLLAVIEQLASVVMWLHMSGTHHGDIKPSNVLVVPSNRGLQVKLTDLVWARAGLSGFTEYQKAYVPPEVMAGQETSAASDQWAVAKILQQLVVKGSPGRSQTEALSMLPVDLVKSIQRALDTKPDHRFPAMAMFVESLRRHQEQHSSDPVRMPAHPIGYASSTPASQPDADEVVELHRVDPSEDVPPVRTGEFTDREASFGAFNPAADLELPIDSPGTSAGRNGSFGIYDSPSERAGRTDIVALDDDDVSIEGMKSNALQWIAIVVASFAIVVGGGYLIVGFSDDAPAIGAAPLSPPPKRIDEPPPAPTDDALLSPTPTPTVAEARLVAPAAGDKGVEIAKKCIAGKSRACLKAGEMFLEGRGGLTASSTEALALFDRACTLHSMAGCRRAADILVEMGDAKRARELYEKACDSASAHSCEKLSLLWREGTGGLKNERTADAFLNRACQLGRKSSCK